jgi:hypothetical protein
VVEFFRFFILESVVQSAARYEAVLAPTFRTAFAQYADAEYAAEARALLGGMAERAAADGDAHLLAVPELARNFSYDDLFAINAYDAFETWACSQLVAWGPASADGATLTARNMDGEVDVRHATVAAALLFAHAPPPPAKGWVSVMWPGHLGSFSLLAEDGIYGMMNAGSDRPGGPATNSHRYATTWVLRKTIEATTAASSARDLHDAVAAYNSAAGGACDPGCIFVWARPADANSSLPGGMIYEGDRLGGSVRVEGAAPPYVQGVVMATNHFLQTGVVPPTPPARSFPAALTCCDGCNCSFSSQFRYAAGSQYVGRLARADRGVDVDAARTWLTHVTHGTTEHSVITRPGARMFGLMVADSRGLWDAPYRPIDWVHVPTILREARGI